MEHKINILANTLEGMLTDAEDNGREGIQPMLAPDDVKNILYALKRTYEPCEEVCCKDAQSSPRLPLKQKELASTAAGMTSPDYRDRFKAEYIQTKIRYERLGAFLTKIEAANRTAFAETEKGEICIAMPAHDCPEHLLRDQLHAMFEYLHILEIRAVIEGIDLGAL